MARRPSSWDSAASASRALPRRPTSRAWPSALPAAASGRILGLTSYYDIVADVPRLHIGFTWNRPSAHGTGTNAESKLLLLRHAFETLGVFRVGLTTQWVNFQSRAAIERLGAKQDGVMRAMSRYRNGALRDSVEYSIIEPEWPAVRANLEARLARRR